MVSFTESTREDVIPARSPGLARLAALQEEIYRQLMLLIPEESTHYDWMVSRVQGSPPLYLQIMERHPYTWFLRLTYAFREEDSDGPATVSNPNAHLRLYLDARTAEVTSYSFEQGIHRLASPWLPPRSVMLRAWRLNRAMDKWLGYLLHQGHTVDSMRPAGDELPEMPPQAALVPAL